jgi:hypothetical protein
MAELLTGWHPDPYAMHELRYFSMDGRPTRLVRDGGVQSSDPPPIDGLIPKPLVPAEPPAVAHTGAEPPREQIPAPAPPQAPFLPPPVAPPQQDQAVKQEHWPATVHGWHSDPFHLHEDRYFTRGEPTRLVRDHGIESYDEPPGSPPRPLSHPPALLGTQLPAENLLSGPSRQISTPAEPAGIAAAPAHPTKAHRRRRRFFGGGGLLGAMGIVVAVVLSTVGSGSNAQAALISAVNASLSDKSAHLTESGSVRASGLTVATTGSGSVDFTTDEVQIGLQVKVKGVDQDETAIYDAGVVYEQLPQIAQLLPGKSWVSLDLASLNPRSSSAPGPSNLGSDPIAELRLLALQGNTVTALGSSSINGVTVQGYSVTLNSSAINDELKGSDLPAWMKQTLSHVNVIGAIDRVYVNGSGELARTTSTDTESAAGITVTVSEATDYSDYGAAVSISIPPASQVAPLTEFLQKTGQ